MGDRGQLESEIEMYQKALAIKPDFGQAWSNLGVALASSGRVDEAETPFVNACQYQPESRQNWMNLARLHMAKGRKDMAQEAMAKAQAMPPG